MIILRKEKNTGNFDITFLCLTFYCIIYINYVCLIMLQKNKYIYLRLARVKIPYEEDLPPESRQ